MEEAPDRAVYVVVIVRYQLGVDPGRRRSTDRMTTRAIMSRVY
jgi:hypothetical protein